MTREESEGTEVSDGISSFMGGIGFVFLTPSVWPFAAVPILLVTFLLCGFGYGGWWESGQLAESWVGHEGPWAQAGYWTIRVLLFLVFSILALFAALVLARPL